MSFLTVNLIFARLFIPALNSYYERCNFRQTKTKFTVQLRKFLFQKRMMKGKKINHLQKKMVVAKLQSIYLADFLDNLYGVALYFEIGNRACTVQNNFWKD